MWKCSHCGGEVVDRLSFCSHCGEPKETIKPQETKTKTKTKTKTPKVVLVETNETVELLEKSGNSIKSYFTISMIVVWILFAICMLILICTTPMEISLSVLVGGLIVLGINAYVFKISGNYICSLSKVMAMVMRKLDKIDKNISQLQ